MVNYHEACEMMYAQNHDDSTVMPFGVHLIRVTGGIAVCKNAYECVIIMSNGEYILKRVGGDPQDTRQIISYFSPCMARLVSGNTYIACLPEMHMLFYGMCVSSAGVLLNSPINTSLRRVARKKYVIPPCYGTTQGEVILACIINGHDNEVIPCL